MDSGIRLCVVLCCQRTLTPERGWVRELQYKPISLTVPYCWDVEEDGNEMRIG